MKRSWEKIGKGLHEEMTRGNKLLYGINISYRKGNTEPTDAIENIDAQGIDNRLKKKYYCELLNVVTIKDQHQNVQEKGEQREEDTA